MGLDPTERGQGQPDNTPQPESGQDPYSGYGSPENPYGTPQQNPLQNPYDPNIQNPYGAPPPQYGGPPPYENAGYQQQASYGYVPPQSPRSLSVAIQELPQQYIKICTRPSVQSFVQEMGKADWAIVWVQLLALAVISAIFGYLGSLISHAPAFTTGSSSAYTSLFTTLAVGGSIFSIISVPLFFFIGAGVQYLLARAFRGEGTFLQQCYTALLYQVPLGIISRVIGLVPILGGIVAFALSIYGIVLNVFAIMAVHRLSGGKATAVVLIPVGIVILLFICLVVLLVVILAAAFRTTSP